MGMAGGSKGGANSNINVTPLVDVVLVLLIIFMVVTPMLQKGKDVELPKAAKRDDSGGKKDSDPLFLSVTADGKMYLDQDEHDAENLKAMLELELLKNPKKKILLKGDSSLSYGEVKRVMKVAQDAKAKSISLAVQEVKN